MHSEFKWTFIQLDAHKFHSNLCFGGWWVHITYFHSKSLEFLKYSNENWNFGILRTAQKPLWWQKLTSRAAFVNGKAFTTKLSYCNTIQYGTECICLGDKMWCIFISWVLICGSMHRFESHSFCDMCIIFCGFDAVAIVALFFCSLQYRTCITASADITHALNDFWIEQVLVFRSSKRNFYGIHSFEWCCCHRIYWLTISGWHFSSWMQFLLHTPFL